MGYSGKYVHQFKDANIGSVVGISCNADYPHFSFEVVKVEEGNVTLRDGGTELTLPIHTRRMKGNPRFEIPPYVQEFATVEQVSTYERLFRNGMPAKLDVMPFSGQRF